MAFRPVEESIEKILKLLEDGEEKTVILVGQPGVGKTWMARELSDRATRQPGVGKTWMARELSDRATERHFHLTLWVFLNRKYDRMALCQSFARQLYLLSTAEEFEDDDYEEEEDREEEIEQNLSQKISKELAGKRILLILDDEGKKMKKDEIMLELETLLNLNEKSSYKVLITTTNNLDSNNSEDSTRSVIKVEPLSEEESKSLLQERAGTTVFQLPGIEPLVNECVRRSMGMPAEIVVIGEALSYIGQCDSGVQKLEIALDEVTSEESFGIALLLRCGYDRLPSGVVIDCCWPNSHFFRDRGFVHYNELIAYWIMEGYLGQVDCIKKAYEKGYHVLMKLIDFCMLKTEEPNYVVMKRTTINLNYCDRRGFGGAASLGLANVFRDGEWEGLGRIAQVDGMIRSLSSGMKGRKLSTLLLDGNSIGSEIPNYLLQSKQDLQVLAVFNPTFKSLSESLSDMNNLNVLVLRGCHFLQKIDDVLKLRRLTALEISGSNFLQKIPDDFFRNTPLLGSINLSGLQIRSLPSSLYELSELSWLILRGCSRLRKLDSLRRLRKLVVLDLSGATSLEIIMDESFSQNMELQFLNFSYASGAEIPEMKALVGLTHLVLVGTNIPDMIDSSLASLQILDLSGGETLSDDITISELFIVRHLLLKNFTDHIQGLRLKSMSKLEVLDLSGCRVREGLENDSFEQMSRLERLDLSETNVEMLPNLSNLSNLRHLLLKNCTHLSGIPPLESLSKLEELNLRGISSLQKTGVGFLAHMSRLQILDLSETKLEHLPSLSNLKNLHELYLSGCPDLKTVPDLEALTKLTVLDLSGTAISHLPSLKSFSNLRELLLRDCSCLEEFPQLELLDVLGATVKEVPYGISELTHLKLLDLPIMKNIEGAKELNSYDWGISTLSTEIVGDSNRLPILVSGTQFLQLLEKTSTLWDTSFKKFHFSIRPIEEKNRKGGLCFHGDYFISRDIYVRTGHLSDFEEQRSLEISGFSEFPVDVNKVLGHADFIFLIDNTFESWLDDLDASDLEAMKGCWIEKCTEIESTLDSLGDTSEAFQNLKYLYLDSCPKLQTVCSSSELPKNLQVLHIKFCDTLKTLFVPTSLKPELQNLDTLHLWELPKLKTIGCSLPSLQTIKIGECPMLEKVFSSSWPPENLQILQIRSCASLQRVFEADITLPKLRTLHLQELPKLEAIGARLPPQSDCNCIIINCPRCKYSLEQKMDTLRDA